MVSQYGIFWLDGKPFNRLPDPASCHGSLKAVPYCDLHLAADQLQPTEHPSICGLFLNLCAVAGRHPGGVLICVPIQRMG